MLHIVIYIYYSCLETDGSYGLLSFKMHMHICTQNFTHNFKKFRMSNIYVLHVKKNLEEYIAHG